MVSIPAKREEIRGRGETAAFKAKVESGSVAPSSKTNGEKLSIDNAVQFFEGGNTSTLVFTNNGQRASSTWYRVYVLDGDDMQWQVHSEGVVTLQPNTVYSQQFHKWRAADWQADYGPA